MNYRDGLEMSFPVAGLLEKLTENREEHKKIITEAKKNYLVALKSELENKLNLLGEGKQINPHSNLPVPGDNLQEYDTAISMLGFTNDTNVVLTQQQYHCYVEDKWSWQSDFLSVASNYSQLANTKMLS